MQSDSLGRSGDSVGGGMFSFPCFRSNGQSCVACTCSSSEDLVSEEGWGWTSLGDGARATPALKEGSASLQENITWILETVVDETEPCYLLQRGPTWIQDLLSSQVPVWPLGWLKAG